MSAGVAMLRGGASALSLAMPPVVPVAWPVAPLAGPTLIGPTLVGLRGCARSAATGASGGNVELFAIAFGLCGLVMGGVGLAVLLAARRYVPRGGVSSEPIR